ncbi:14758_t:CDS:2 [Entrophospora sp. SA101]|nr:14758_t:CDS:2 [Entrophospora sp. SA101]
MSDGSQLQFVNVNSKSASVSQILDDTQRVQKRSSGISGY